MRNHKKIIKLLKIEAASKQPVIIDPNKYLSCEELISAAFSKTMIKTKNELIQKAYEYVQALAIDRKAVYGLTTSFGGNINHIIPPEEAKLLQKNLILCHATNVGEFFPYEISKAAFILRITTLSKGYSGVSLTTIKLATQMIEAGLVPAINIHGSLGASGDIAPLACIALSMIGKGKLWLPDGKSVVSSKKGLKRYDLKPIKLSYKEGLALLNGTSMMTSVGAVNLHFLKHFIENSLVVAAMSIEVLRGSKKPFDSRLHALKPHRFEINTASVMELILRQSKFALSHSELKSGIEKELRLRSETFYSNTDLQGGSYSMRAIPQVYHPILANYDLFKTTVETEINAIDDNPIVLPDEHDELHGANFHGYPISVASDNMNLAMVGISNLALARIDRMLKSTHSRLPWFLATGKEGLFLGMHGIQFTAAGIGAELKNLTLPLSIVQIPTNNDNQDFVSFGLQSTTKGLEMTLLAAYVIAIEWICAGQGIWLHLNKPRPSLSIEGLSEVSRMAYLEMLKVYRPIKNKDQNMTEQIEKLSEVILTKSLLPKQLSEKLWS